MSGCGLGFSSEIELRPLAAVETVVFESLLDRGVGNAMTVAEFPSDNAGFPLTVTDATVVLRRLGPWLVIPV